MRQPSQLPSVLFDLARLPGVANLLRNPPALTTYLRGQAWPENLDETEAAEADSEESQELAEMTPIVEEWLTSLKPEAVQNLSAAVEKVTPGSAEVLQNLLPVKLSKV